MDNQNKTNQVSLAEDEDLSHNDPRKIEAAPHKFQTIQSAFTFAVIQQTQFPSSMSNFQKLIYHLVLNEFSNSIRGN
jgi:hypothetical protein